MPQLIVSAATIDITILCITDSPVFAFKIKKLTDNSIRFRIFLKNARNRSSVFETCFVTSGCSLSGKAFLLFLKDTDPELLSGFIQQVQDITDYLMVKEDFPFSYTSAFPEREVRYLDYH